MFSAAAAAARVFCILLASNLNVDFFLFLNRRPSVRSVLRSGGSVVVVALFLLVKSVQTLYVVVVGGFAQESNKHPTRDCTKRTNVTQGDGDVDVYIVVYMDDDNDDDKDDDDTHIYVQHAKKRM